MKCMSPEEQLQSVHADSHIYVHVYIHTYTYIYTYNRIKAKLYKYNKMKMFKVSNVNSFWLTLDLDMMGSFRF